MSNISWALLGLSKKKKRVKDFDIQAFVVNEK